MSKAFKQFNERTKNSILLVDGLNLAFRDKHAKAKVFAEDYLNRIESLANSYKCDKIVVVTDFKSSTFRKSIFPEYKQNRKEKYENQTELEKLEAEEFFIEFNRTLDLIADKYTLFKFEGVEADDIAAYIVKSRENFGISSIQLISSDKDWDLLINPYTSRFSYVTRKDVTWDNWDTHYDCTPDDYLSLKVLMGDQGDNINGIEGVAPKRALSLIQQYGSAFEIFDSLPINSKYAYVKSLNNSGELILRNYQLMDILTYCEDAIGEENLKEINTKMKGLFNELG